MAKTGSERQDDLRKRRAELGLKRREYFLTDAEKIKVDKYIKLIKRN